MKALAIVLVLSLVGNAAWLVFHFKETSARERSMQVDRHGGSADAAAGTETGSGASQDLAAKGGKIVGADGKAIDPKLWTHLYSGDLKSLVARLKAAGFPASVIRTLVVAEVGRQFSDRRKALYSNNKEEAYWSNNRRGRMDAATIAEARALEKEFRALTKDLLSDLPPDPNSNSDNMQRRVYGDLPAEKIQQLRQLTDDYNELTQEIYSNAQGVLLSEDREKLAYLEKEKRADIEQLLTPAERLEYNLRSSQLANSLRGRFNSFEPTEAEYRAIFTAAQAMGMVDQPASPDQFRQRDEAILNAVRSTLTPERFAEYERASNPMYAQASRLVSRLNLPPATAGQLVSVEQASQRQAEAIRRDTTLTAEQRTAQLQTIATQATQQITTMLGGERGMEAYRQFGGGWLRSLTTPSSSSARTRAQPLIGR